MVASQCTRCHALRHAQACAARLFHPCLHVPDGVAGVNRRSAGPAISITLTAPRLLPAALANRTAFPVQTTPIPRWLALVLLLGIAVVFGSNHVAARVAFEHGASVTSAVVARSVFTALFVLALMRLQGVRFALAGPQRARAMLIGVLIAAQSYCLYSAVSLLPVALALLVFNSFPMLLVLLAWWVEGERPAPRALVAMPLALAGLALTLDVFGSTAGLAGRRAEIGPGVLYAAAAAFFFAAALFLTGRWLKDVDGRLRTFLSMSVTAVLLLGGGLVAGSFSWPADASGWTGLALLCVFYASAFTALFVLLPRVGATSNTVALNFEPIAVLGIAWVVLGQAVAPRQVLGAFIVVGAIVLLNTGKR